MKKKKVRKKFKTIKTTLVKLSVCPCGETLLDDKIKIGRVYNVVPELTEVLSFVCGKCHQKRRLVCVWTKGKNKSGYMPVEIFDFLEQSEITSFAA